MTTGAGPKPVGPERGISPSAEEEESAPCLLAL